MMRFALYPKNCEKGNNGNLFCLTQLTNDLLYLRTRYTGRMIWHELAEESPETSGGMEEPQRNVGLSAQAVHSRFL
jgi:hypothetical protein